MAAEAARGAGASDRVSDRVSARPRGGAPSRLRRLRGPVVGAHPQPPPARVHDRTPHGLQRTAAGLEDPVLVVMRELRRDDRAGLRRRVRRWLAPLHRASPLMPPERAARRGPSHVPAFNLQLIRAGDRHRLAGAGRHGAPADEAPGPEARTAGDRVGAPTPGTRGGLAGRVRGGGRMPTTAAAPGPLPCPAAEPLGREDARLYARLRQDDELHEAGPAHTLAAAEGKARAGPETLIHLCVAPGLGALLLGGAGRPHRPQALCLANTWSPQAGQIHSPCLKT